VRLGVELNDLAPPPQGVYAQIVGDGQQPRLETVLGVEGL
jgi:hypothetical protein